LKTHGCASKPDTLVLGLKDFRDCIHDNRPVQMLLQTIFLRYQVLFIGHSLTDPDLLFMLDQLVTTYGVPRQAPCPDQGCGCGTAKGKNI
jgi:hypothetical protein